MKLISKIKTMKRNSLENEFASEIVEIFEEKLEDLKVTLPGNIESEADKESRIKSKVRKELICSVEEFIYLNKNKLLKKAV